MYAIPLAVTPSRYSASMEVAMAPDFRSDRMDSPEGKGRARRAWDAYAAAVNKTVGPVLVPIISRAAEPVAREWVEDLVGFWILWHLYGGFEGLERYGFHRATI